MRIWPGCPGSARCHVGRRGHQLRGLLRARDGGGSVPLRRSRGRTGVGARPTSGADRPDLARLPAGGASRPAVRLPGARPVRAGGGPPLQPGQAAARSLRQGDQRAPFAGATRCRATPWSQPMETRDLVPDPSDSAAGMPKCVVVESAFSWGDDKNPRTPWNRTVIYEAHVKGMTMLHPEIPEEIRGTYLGLATDPDHRSSPRRWASPRSSCCRCTTSSPSAGWPRWGSSNYWGYGTIGFFAPDVRYATGGLGQQVAEFKSMVKRFHRAGHRGDPRRGVQPHGGREPPGADAQLPRPRQLRRTTASIPADRRYYTDYTGCGNTVDIRHSRTMQLVMDSLRYWVEAMHVDGFRFDLAPVLARGDVDVSPFAEFFDVVRQDPRRLPRKAHRGAVGPRSRRLPGRPISRSAGASGTASTATPCGSSGAASRARSANSPPGSPAAVTCSRPASAAPRRASTS